MTKKKQAIIVMIFYIVCFVFRLLEYFVLRTDKTWIGEAVIHKMIGIVMLFLAAKALAASPKDCGFVREKCVSGILMGLGFGVVSFTIAYGVEILISLLQGDFQALQIYVSAYAIDKNIGNQTEIIFFFICIFGNVINVIMEEGIFRGFFIWLLEKKHTFLWSSVFSSVLFGIWHVVGPIRNYYDGISSLEGTIANISMLLLTSCLVGFKFVLLTKMTGNLFMAMGDHFVNNTIVNTLHVITSTGADELMFVRLTIAQSVSCVVVIVCYIYKTYFKRCFT